MLIGTSLLACRKNGPSEPQPPQNIQREQVPPTKPDDGASPTKTIYVMRHAEKEAIRGEHDPPLTDVGIARSEALRDRLEQTKVDAIYSSEYRRTMQTALPTAEANQQTITTYNPAADPREFAELLRSSPAESILVIGHSNTIPPLLYAFGSEIEAIGESQYGDLYVLTIRGDKVTLQVEEVVLESTHESPSP